MPIEDVGSTRKELIGAGIVRHVGLSEAAAATIRAAHAVQPVAAIQSEYSRWTGEPESQILPLCAEREIGFVPWSPLGQGSLTGRIDSSARLEGSDWHKNFPRYTPEAIAANRALVRLLQDLAAAKATRTTHDLAAIAKTSASVEIHDARLPEAILQYSYR